MAAVDNLIRAQNNYSRILVMVTEMIAGTPPGQNPTQAQIDAVVATAEGAGIIVPRPDLSLDGESYQWSAYQETCNRMIVELQKSIVILQGPYEVRSRCI